MSAEDAAVAAEVCSIMAKETDHKSQYDGPYSTLFRIVAGSSSLWREFFQLELAKCAIRARLASLHEEAGRYVEAAETLKKISTDSAQRPCSPAQKMALYLRIGRLLLDSGDYAEAEQYVNRASLLQTEKDCDSYNVEYKVRELEGCV
ncbi:hypothetical protein TELCIR_08594 [Teladorsagia circumcincta]|uniref:PSMD12/CSN4-like N-terminal domain-containing protein n=1 Tax=Teladorsagia circumcincta TaxID=45464 RepID=A0A2G9UH44_TELCI|nr:hypothetical protein TELCIR_08594 [Teladorsagia circumcincta]